MKLIFLDIDGVLNSHQSYNYHNRITHNYEMADILCPIATCNLGYILDLHPDCSIVISSSWRKSRSVDDLGNILEKYNIDRHRIIDKTPVNSSGEIRGNQIKAWMEANPDIMKQVSHYLILDDDNDMTYFLNTPHFIRTNPKLGLSWLETEQALMYFGDYVLSFNDLKENTDYLAFSRPQDMIFQVKNGLCYLKTESKLEHFTLLDLDNEKFSFFNK